MSELVTFSLPCLKKLLITENSCVFCEPNYNRSMILSPIHLSDIKKSVKEALASKVTCYDIELKGIILSHKNIKIFDSIKLGDDGNFKLDYIADIYIFRPTIGCKLTGKVNKKGKDVIGCLVHSIFNVAITKPKGKGCLKWQGYELQIGQTITFTVVKLDFSGRLPYIKGELVNAEEVTDDGIDSGFGNQEAVNGGNKKKKYKHHELSKSFCESAGTSLKNSLGEFSGSVKRKREPEDQESISPKKKKENIDDENEFELIKEIKIKNVNTKYGDNVSKDNTVSTINKKELSISQQIKDEETLTIGSPDHVKKHKKKNKVKELNPKSVKLDSIVEITKTAEPEKICSLVDSLIKETNLDALITSPKVKKNKASTDVGISSAIKEKELTKKHKKTIKIEPDLESDELSKRETKATISSAESLENLGLILDAKKVKKKEKSSKPELKSPLKNLDLKDITRKLIRNSLSSDEKEKDSDKSGKKKKKEKKSLPSSKITEELLAQALSSL